MDARSPKPRRVADVSSGVVIYRKLPGRPYLLAGADDPTAVTHSLGRLLRTLHGLSGDVDLPRDHQRIEEWLADATATAARIDPPLPADRRTVIRQFLAAPPPADAAHNTLCHNDLGAEHLLIDERSGVLSGVIDWTDAAFTDPARDIALICRDLGPDAAAAVAGIAGIAEPELLGRATFLARASGSKTSPTPSRTHRPGSRTCTTRIEPSGTRSSSEQVS